MHAEGLTLFQKVRDVRVPGGGVPSLSSCHWLSKTLWFVTTGRNALVVVTCIIVCYILENNGITPFTLTGSFPYFKCNVFSVLTKHHKKPLNDHLTISYLV